MKELNMHNRPSVPELYKPEWVLEGELARSQRPGYPKDKPTFSTMNDWMETVLSLGIKSIICIMDQNQVDKYYGIENIGDGGISFYKKNGFSRLFSMNSIALLVRSSIINPEPSA